MNAIVKVITPAGRVIPILSNQVEDYLKAGCKVMSDEDIINQAPIKPPDIEDTLICPICGLQTKTKKGLLTHKKSKHSIG